MSINKQPPMQENAVQEQPLLKVFINTINTDIYDIYDVVSIINNRIGCIDGKTEPQAESLPCKEANCFVDELSLIQDKVRSLGLKLIDINSRLAKQVG